jgi:BirA family biotin operon repressor/biotin-[acetyl-CoA-carboxylase] ligase
VLIDASHMQLGSNVLPKVPLAVGLALCDALDAALGGRVLGLKWPNDVLADGRKLCGILAEVPPIRKDLLVLGVGVNVNNQLNDVPAELHSRVTSLRELAGRTLSQSDVLTAILERLSERLHWIAWRPDELQDAWHQRCLLTGRNVRIEMPNRCLWGTCRGIDREGALVVETAADRQRILSGVILQWS